MVRLKHGQGAIHLKVRLNKNGSVTKFYEGRFTDELGKRKSVYAKTQKECYELIKRSNPNFKTNKTRHKHVTVESWLTEWFENYKKPTLRPSTLKSYLVFMNKLILPALGEKKLIDLNGQEVQKFLLSIKAGNTQKKCYLLLSAALKKACVLKKLRDNVCDTVELPKYKKQKRRPFEYDEQNIILNGDKKLSQAFFFLCATGLRIGEFLALTKEDFYPERHVFVVNKSIVHGKLGEPKTESSNRIVCYTDELFNFFDFNSLGTYNYEALKTALQRLLKKENIEGVSWHSTRHTFATICHSLGMIDKQLQTLLGHSTLAMTQDVYTHLLKAGDSPIKTYLKGMYTTFYTTL